MSKYGEFFLEFMEPFFDGLLSIFQNIFLGIFEMFNVLNYIEVIEKYQSDLTGGGIFVIILTVGLLLLVYGILLAIIIAIVKRFIKYRRNIIKQESMIEEIERLNQTVTKYRDENQKFLSLGEGEVGEDGEIIKPLNENDIRFYRLTKVDEDLKTYTAPEYNKSFTLNEFCDNFRNYSASKLKLYYDIKIIRLFVAALASNRLIILQGISGTGKTSLAYAFGNMINNETTIASVQPSWRDSTELFGYFNEFTKKYNETEVLTKLYEATFKEDVFITLLDEMNISRVEYYFAEMLSVLELPNKKDWVINIVPSAWENDPTNIVDGRMQLPTNMWYVGTINNDDSTFMVTDKVYDRAMPINIDDKSSPFEAPAVEPMNLSSTYLVELFAKAQEEYKVSEEMLRKIEDMDRYVIDHFRLAFGNRILKHLKEFVPVYVACGGTEIDGIDYVMANKILRKFDQLNLSLIKNEIDGYIAYLNQNFGQDLMKECIAYLERLKKTI